MRAILSHPRAIVDEHELELVVAQTRALGRKRRAGHAVEARPIPAPVGSTRTLERTVRVGDVTSVAHPVATRAPRRVEKTAEKQQRQGPPHNQQDDRQSRQTAISLGGTLPSPVTRTKKGAAPCGATPR